jgi:glycosyltransferase involved in cell wall biosynthesis
MQSDQLTLLIPVFNREIDLPSFLAQISRDLSPDIPIIFSDNCSSDNSFTLLTEFSHKRENVTIYRQSVNIGALKNFSFLFLKTTTQYAMIFPVGDRLSHDYFIEVLAAIDSNPGVTSFMPKYEVIQGKDTIYEVHFTDEGRKSFVQRYWYFSKNTPGIAIYGVHNVSHIQKFLPLPLLRGADASFLKVVFTLGVTHFLPQIRYSFFVGTKWNSYDQDTRFFFGDLAPSSEGYRDTRALHFTNLLKYERTSILKNNSSIRIRLGLLVAQALIIISKIVKKSIEILINSFPNRVRIEFARFIYWQIFVPRYVHKPNGMLFVRREILPYLRVKARYH